MYQQLKKSSGNILGFRISGTITKKQFKEINGILEQAIARHGSIRLFVVMEHYPSLNSAESLYDDLRFAKLHSDHIEKMAVVGDRVWKSTWVGIFGLFSQIQTQYFDRSQAEAAWQWVRAG